MNEEACLLAVLLITSKHPSNTIPHTHHNESYTLTLLRHILTTVLSLQLTFPKAKLLLMSSNQEDLNDWYQSLSSAVRYVPATHTDTVKHK